VLPFVGPASIGVALADGVPVLAFVSAVENRLDHPRDRLGHVFGGLARVDPAAVRHVGVGLDRERLATRIEHGGAGRPRSAFDAENTHWSLVSLR
jgi:hypothetical protein